MNPPDLNNAFVKLEWQIREVNRQKSVFADEIEVLKNEELVVIRVGFEKERQKAVEFHQKKNQLDQLMKEKNDLKKRLLKRLASFEKNKSDLMVQITNLREKDHQIKCELKKHQMNLKNSLSLYQCMKKEFKLEYESLDKNHKELEEQRNNAGQAYDTLGNEFLELNGNQKEINNEVTIAEMKVKDLKEQIQKEKSIEELILIQIQKDADEHRQKVEDNGKVYEDKERKVNDDWSELDADLAASKIRLSKVNEELVLGNEELSVLVKEQDKINEMEVQEMKEAHEAEDDIKIIEDEIKEVQDELDAKENELEYEKLAHEKGMEECRRIQAKLDFLKESEMELENLIKEEELILKSGREIEASLNSVKSEGHRLFFEKLTIESSLRMSLDSVLDAKNQSKMANLEMEYLRNSEIKIKEEHDKMQAELNIKMKSIMSLFEKIKPDEPEKQLENAGNSNSSEIVIEKNDIIEVAKNEKISSRAEQIQNKLPLIAVSKPVAKTKSLDNDETIKETEIVSSEKEKSFDDRLASPTVKPFEFEEDVISKEKTNKRKADDNKHSQDYGKKDNRKFFKSAPIQPQAPIPKAVEKSPSFEKLNKDNWNNSIELVRDEIIIQKASTPIASKRQYSKSYQSPKNKQPQEKVKFTQAQAQDYDLQSDDEYDNFDLPKSKPNEYPTKNNNNKAKSPMKEKLSKDKDTPYYMYNSKKTKAVIPSVSVPKSKSSAFAPSAASTDVKTGKRKTAPRKAKEDLNSKKRAYAYCPFSSDSSDSEESVVFSKRPKIFA